MEALSRVLVERTIKRVPSTRFYFKTFPFRVMFDASQYALKVFEQPNREDQYIYTQDAQWRGAARDMVQALKLTGTWKERNQAGYGCVYFETEADVVSFLAAYGDYVIEVAMPESAAALQAMSSDYRVLVRDTLFWGQYRWSGVLKQLSDEQLEEMREWIASFKDTAIGGVELSYSHSAPRIFFAEEDDFCMFCFAYRQHIARIEKVLLKEEIANESVSTEGAC